MSLYDDLRKKLSPDVFSQVTDALGDDFDYDVVPRSRLNKVIRQRNEWREKAEGMTQDTLKPGSEEEDDDPTPSATGKPKAKGAPIDEAALRATWEQESKAREEGLRVEFAALNQLREDGAIDPELVLSQFDKSKLKREDGKLVGYQEQCDALREAKSFLFHQKRQRRQDAQAGTGKAHEEGDPASFDGAMTKEEFLKLNYQQQLDFKAAHPDQFKAFLGH